MIAHFCLQLKKPKEEKEKLKQLTNILLERAKCLSQL